MSTATKRRPVVTYTRCTTLTGRLRRWFNYRVRGYNSETCGRCGRGYWQTWWCPDNEMFIELADGPLSCPRCFDRSAEAHGVRLVWQAVPIAEMECTPRVPARNIPDSGHKTGSDQQLSPRATSSVGVREDT